jgi:hypothetical protein
MGKVWSTGNLEFVLRMKAWPKLREGLSPKGERVRKDVAAE